MQTAEGGSGYIRSKVLRAVLEGEREVIAQGETARSSLAPANYTFQPLGVDEQGLANVLFTPGHSPGHVTYALRDSDADPVMLFSGDVLFQQSVGRTDLPGGDHATLLQSIATLLERYDDDTVVHPGHMGLTTLGRERATNPFLAELAQ